MGYDFVRNDRPRNAFTRGSKPSAGEPSAAGSGGSGAAAPDYHAEVSEVHKQLFVSAKNIDTVLARSSKPFANGVILLAAASPLQEKPNAAGSGDSGAAAPDYRTARRR